MAVAEENGETYSYVVDGKHSAVNGDSHSHKDANGDKTHKSSKRNETEEERRIRKEKEKLQRSKETEEERAIRKEKERRKMNETEEERVIRKQKEKERVKKNNKAEETEEERRIRKEKEREARKNETEEERKIRKEKEREREKAKSSSSHHKSNETDEERRIRKEKERVEKAKRDEKKRKEKGKSPMNGDESTDHTFKDEMKSEPMDDETQTNGTNHVKEENDEMVDQGFDPEDQEEEEEQEEDDDDQEEEEEEDWGNKKDRRRSSSSKKDKHRSSTSHKKRKSSSSSKSSHSKSKKVKKEEEQWSEEEEVKPKQTATPSPSKRKSDVKTEPNSSSTKKVKKEENVEVWKWWEEEKPTNDSGVKWNFLQHRGPLFAPDYTPLPSSVHFFYDGKRTKLSPPTEEVATFYGRMIEHDYTTKEVFNRNFLKDWRKVMNESERELIRDLGKCDFNQINDYFKKVSEERKGRSKDEKKVEKDKNEAIQKEYGICVVDGHNEKIGNFRIEPPGLFRGRGEHPKQGMLKKRVNPEDVIINCSADSVIPAPPKGHKWKKVQHDNAVTWLASWTENVQNQIKYVMLNPSSKLKGEKDMQKYEKARELKVRIVKIREDYYADLKSKEMRIRQRAVALYFIDKLALRAGNEKDDDQADTVGCCSLRVEHIILHPEKDGEEFVVEFDFLGKDSIRYNNSVAVEKRVYKNVQLFMESKKKGDDLFDRLNTSILNEYLNGLMPGLTAKVFRTYNASFTLQEQLEKLTSEDDNVTAKMLSYNRANRAVAVLCNHQRAIPKTHEKSMDNLKGKIETKNELISKAEDDLANVKKAYKNNKTTKAEVEKKKKALERALEQREKLETQAVDKEENKTIALGTSKLNYLDPRISVAWCKKFEVPMEKVYNKTQREKFRWAIDMAGPDYVF